MPPPSGLTLSIGALAANRDLDERRFIDGVLHRLVDWGFRSVRYWEVIRSPHDTNRDVAVLRQAFYADGFVPQIGLKVPYSDTTIARGAKRDDVASSDIHDSPPEAQKWIEALKLEDDRWMDIALRDAGGETVALLALSRPLEAAALSAEELDHISVIRQCVEGRLMIEAFRQLFLKADRQYREARRGHLRSRSDLAMLCARLALTASGGRACSVFYYNWVDRRLEKIVELHAPHITRAAVSPTEQYYVGQNITGSAWSDPKFRFVASYEDLLREGYSNSALECVPYYEEAVGGIHSLLFARVGRRHARFLVRVINRADDGRLPFNKTSRQAFEAVCADLSDTLDEFANQVVIRQFDELASKGLRQFRDVPGLAATTLRCLEAIGFGAGVVLSKPAGSPAFEVIGSFDPILSDVFAKRDDQAQSVSFMSTLQDFEGLGGVPLSNWARGEDALCDNLKRAGIKALLVVAAPRNGACIRAVRAIYEDPLDVSLTTRFVTDEDRDAAVALVSMLRAVVEASRANLSIEEANGLLAYLGHELKAPFNRLHGAAFEGLNAALALLKSANADAEGIAQLQANKELVDQQSEYVKHHISSGIAMAEDSQSHLDVKFEQFRWSDIIKEAWNDALTWRAGADDQSPRGAFDLKLNPALDSMSSVGDQFYLRIVVVNLLKNALKYSMPRYRGKPMEVRVVGEPQLNFDVIRIHNWGSGIPSDQLETIFERYVRVDRADRIRAIRGSGLGLYFARQYAKAHDGTLFCLESKSTLDDPVRIDNLEGFSTTFSLRIPRNQPRGVHKIRIK